MPEKPPKTIRTLVVDDEPLARRNLTVLLREDPEINPLEECRSGLEAIAAIRKDRPSLLFLDIQMPAVDGFDVLEMLGREIPAAVVFVTAHDVYALRAFDVGALDYLLKPFDRARFQRALLRAKEKLTQSSPRSQPSPRLIVKAAGEVMFLRVSEIDWIEAADYYVSLHVGNRAHLLRRPLADLERELDPQQFCRIHRSVIVNIDQVCGLQLKADGEYEVVLKSGDHLRLSRRFSKQLRQRIAGIGVPAVGGQ
jgi:two-component system LytT family response regulator